MQHGFNPYHNTLHLVWDFGLRASFGLRTSDLTHGVPGSVPVTEETGRDKGIRTEEGLEAGSFLCPHSLVSLDSCVADSVDRRTLQTGSPRLRNSGTRGWASG